MNFFKYQFRQIKKFPDWVFFLPAKIMLLVRYLMRTEIVDEENILEQKNPPAISVTWHNRLLFLPLLFPRWHRKHTVAVISASRDGQYLADFMKFFKVNALRGSSSRKGANALLGAIREIDSGRNVVFTPDGPRGPKYVIKNGPVVVASKTGGSVVPIVLNSSRCWQLKSWDNFQIPKPFSKLQMIVGDPIEVPRDADEETIEIFRKKAENALLAITVDPASPAAGNDANASH